ncbi:putative holin-like toxin [Lactiplantibacillus plantarum]|uniref:putative holin-like toxin n=1 Tax=Lactiplantibacillus plantarum TaxID=1590 RepID=UPI0023DEC322|nr:putative holin-like toxin [Lactiplantibacillus plantarum]MDF3265863.1 putative holin-like toxin [Lactiplantibacillus plantarum]
MLAFGTFIVALIALIVELIKSQKKNNRLMRCTPKVKVNICLSFLGGTESIVYRRCAA